MHTKQTAEKICAKVNSTCLALSDMEITVCAWVYFLKSAGFSRTSSGETFSSPNDASTFLFISMDAKSKGVAPFRLSRATLLMWLVSLRTSSSVKYEKLFPFGST